MKSWRFLTRLASVLALASNLHGASAADLSQWQWLNPLPQGNALKDVTWDGTRWVAVGEYSTLIASTNGLDWSSLPFTNNFQARGVATSGKTTVVVGWSDYSPQSDQVRTAILVNTNGDTWMPAINGVLTDGLISIAYGGGRWIAAGQFTLFVSADGVTWNSIPRPKEELIYGVSHAGGKFFVLGASGMILTSANGVDFEDVTPAGTFYKTFTSAAFANNKWVVVGSSGASYSSANAVDWVAGNCGSEYVHKIAALTNQFLAIDATGRLRESTDGTTWTIAGAKVPGLLSLACNDTQVVGVGAARIATGVAANAFSPIHTPMLNTIFGVVELNGKLMAWGNRFINDSKSTGYVAMAEAAAPWKTWTISDTPKFNNVAKVSGILVAAGPSGQLYTSVDGTNWVARTTGTYSSLRPITSSPNLIVVGGGEGTILTSPDGEQWTLSALPVRWNIAELLYRNGLFVAALDTGRIYTSPDAKEWTLRFPGEGWTLRSMSWIDGLGFSITASRPDYERTLLSSVDGIAWTEQLLNWPGTVTLGPVNDTAQGLVLLDRGSAMLSLNKGATWEQVPVPFGYTLGATMVSGKLVAYGEFGTLLQLIDPAPPSLSISQTEAGVRITWPETTENWTLESNTSLTNTAGWVPVTYTFVQGGMRIFQQSIDAEPHFFRLKK